jgi:Ca-activated chloride channel family protein
MEFLWPSAFFLLGIIPLIVAVYFWLQRRRRRYAVRYSSLSLVRQAVQSQSRLRRYLPPALFLLALAMLVFGLARPVTVTLVPSGRATVMLALDVSGSMRQRDIPPSRLAAAKSAALSFIDRQQVNNQIGIVAFAGNAQLIQSPTNEKEDLKQAIQSLSTARHTAIGSGILTSLDTIAEYNKDVASVSESGSTTGPVEPVPAGEYVPDIIVLLTDGVYTRGPHPLDAAQQAADRGVRVYTIGFGTNRGAQEQDNDFFGGGWNRGIDEASLKEIAAITGGEYYAASSAGELQKVFESLPTYLNTREETMEITVAFAGIGALLVFCAVMLGQLWSPLP